MVHRNSINVIIRCEKALWFAALAKIFFKNVLDSTADEQPSLSIRKLVFICFGNQHKFGLFCSVVLIMARKVFKCNYV